MASLYQNTSWENSALTQDDLVKGVGQETTLSQRFGADRLNPIEPGLALISGLKSGCGDDQSICYIGPPFVLHEDLGPVIGLEG